MKTTSITLAAASLIGLALGQDRYQKVGNDVGQFYSSVGAVLADPNADPASLSVAAQQADVAVASFKNEIRTMDWSDLGPDAAKQQTSNLEFYVNGLNNANAELHAIANKAAFEKANSNYNDARDMQFQQQQQANSQPQAIPQQRYHVNNRINAIVTGVHNKAVVKGESSTITSSSEPTSSADSKESSRESKSSVKEEKSESRESKKEEKSESRESKKEEKSTSASPGSTNKAAAAASTGNRTANSNSTRSSSSSATTSHHGHKNTGVISSGISGAVLIGALFALL